MGCSCLIIGVTGNVLPADVTFFMEHGAEFVLAKPVDIETFEERLQEFWSKSPPLSVTRIAPSARSTPLLRVSDKKSKDRRNSKTEEKVVPA